MVEEELKTPNWLKELEEKREKRSKTRLFHEMDQGAACTICQSKCPGLDLHFWRKICKNCKCGKDSHETLDDYNYLQPLFDKQPLRSEKSTLKLGIQLEWVPEGNPDVVQEFLRNIPVAQLPVVGSEAAKRRHRQMRHQLPEHDINPEQCHDLEPPELHTMDKYLDDLKRQSIGIGKVIQTALQQSLSIKNTDQIKCNYCTGAIPNKSIAITVERSNALYHPDCFKCHDCNENLVDLMYFNDPKTNRVYCGRDYAKHYGLLRCSACDELIFSTKYCWAEERSFHIKHFCCYHCDTPLAGRKYIIADNQQPYCLQCYEDHKADRCTVCALPIKPSQPATTIEKVHFHANSECFVCTQCKRHLLEQKVLFKDGKLYCSTACFKQGKS